MNGPSLVDCDILVFFDSTGKSNSREKMLSPMISLDNPEGAVLIESEAIMDGDSGLDIEMVREC